MLHCFAVQTQCQERILKEEAADVEMLRQRKLQALASDPSVCVTRGWHKNIWPCPGTCIGHSSRGPSFWFSSKKQTAPKPKELVPWPRLFKRPRLGAPHSPRPQSKHVQNFRRVLELHSCVQYAQAQLPSSAGSDSSRKEHFASNRRFN